MSDPITSLVHDTLTDMSKQTEAWLQRCANAKGLTPEELANIYQIEWSPLEMAEDNGVYKARQTARLVRREA